MSNTSTPAEPPFDGSEGFDIILHTSDGVDFHVYRVVLSLSSGFFKSMFSLPQPPDAAAVPVIDVPERSRVIDPLLRYCYPMPMEPVITDINRVVDVLEAALKYEMPKATTILTNHLHSYMAETPLKLYALACRLHLEEIAFLAAVDWREKCPKSDDEATYNGKLIDWNKTITGSCYTRDIAGISAGAYFRLTQFVRTGRQTSFVLPAKSRALSTSGEHMLVPPTNPFNFTDSDLTILSSDGAQFQVHHFIICLASPVLRKDIANGDGNSRLALPEDGETLSFLLRACYPSMTLGMTFNVQKLTTCLRAAVKYEMTKAVESIVSLLKSAERNEPLDVFFAFITNGFMKEGAEVAQNSLLFKPLDSLYHPSMENVTARFYHHWLKHRHGCLSRILEISYDGAAGMQWWNAVKSSNKFTYLAPPVVAKKLSMLYVKGIYSERKYPLGPSFEISQSDREITGDLYRESCKLTEKLESYKTRKITSLENCFRCQCGEVGLHRF